MHHIGKVRRFCKWCRDPSIFRVDQDIPKTHDICNCIAFLFLRSRYWLQSLTFFNGISAQWRNCYNIQHGFPASLLGEDLLTFAHQEQESILKRRANCFYRLRAITACWQQDVLEISSDSKLATNQRYPNGAENWGRKQPVSCPIAPDHCPLTRQWSLRALCCLRWSGGLEHWSIVWCCSWCRWYEPDLYDSSIQYNSILILLKIPFAWLNMKLLTWEPQNDLRLSSICCTQQYQFGLHSLRWWQWKVGDSVSGDATGTPWL